MNDYLNQRHRMVETQIIGRGIDEPALINAMLKIPREKFLPPELRDNAYSGQALSIGDGQILGDPFTVGLVLSSLGAENLKGKILEVGTGTGYTAAVLSRLASQVFTFERVPRLASMAKERLKDLGYLNIEVIEGDGSQGLHAEAPFDGIVVTAGAPEVPRLLLEQLKIGARLIIPLGKDGGRQQLVRVTRRSEIEFDEEDLGAAHFVPLVEGEDKTKREEFQKTLHQELRGDSHVIRQIRRHLEVFSNIPSVRLDGFLDRVGRCRVVMMGESTHGTSEFYQMRVKMTEELITRKGFNFIAVEADWPDGARVDDFVRNTMTPPSSWRTAARFPHWMWRNREFEAFTRWLREFNQSRDFRNKIAFYGLDLYSLYSSMAEVIKILGARDPSLAKIIRQRYGCLSPWAQNPASYGHDVVMGLVTSCEEQVVTNLETLLKSNLSRRFLDRELFNILENARLVKDSEQYYRKMYYGAHDSWNLRDRHMFETLERLLNYHGSESKAVVWAHNTHVGDASATDMSRRGQLNLGQLCREKFGDRAYLIGFGTDSGSVAAASDWEGPMEIKDLKPSHPKSLEKLFHETETESFFLPLRTLHSATLREELRHSRLERAVGVIYRPETELLSHYFQAKLADQFDEYIWFDRTTALHPLEARRPDHTPDTYPFGL